MTYDWENTLRLSPGSHEWFEEIDRRFLSAAYFAKAEMDDLSGSSRSPNMWPERMCWRSAAVWEPMRLCCRGWERGLPRLT